MPIPTQMWLVFFPCHLPLVHGLVPAAFPVWSSYSHSRPRGFTLLSSECSSLQLLASAPPAVPPPQSLPSPCPRPSSSSVSRLCCLTLAPASPPAHSCPTREQLQPPNGSSSDLGFIRPHSALSSSQTSSFLTLTRGFVQVLGLPSASRAAFVHRWAQLLPQPRAWCGKALGGI